MCCGWPACSLIWTGPADFREQSRRRSGADEIEARFVTAAADLWHDYLWPHACAAIRQIGLDDTHVELRRILHWARATGAAELSFRDVQRHALGRRFDAEQTEKLIDELVTAGWLRET